MYLPILCERILMDFKSDFLYHHLIVREKAEHSKEQRRRNEGEENGESISNRQ